MEQAHQSVAVGHLLHHLHHQLVLVAGGVGVGVDRGHLMLGGGHLVVLGFAEHAQLPQLLIQILHIGGDPGPDGAIVVVVQLLSLGGFAPNRVRPHIRRSSRWAYWALSTRKYSCSGPT